MAAEVNFRCRQCGLGLWAHRPELIEEIECGRCGGVQTTQGPDSLDDKGKLKSCVICGCDHLYRQRDFNRKMGLAIVVVAALFSVKTYGLSLLAAAIIDLALYLRLKEIVLCYHCEAIHRGFQRAEEIQAYDLATHERFEDRDWGKLHEGDAD